MYKYFSHNGKLLPIEQAVVGLTDIEYSYGFGVYETIRVSHGKAVFGHDHCLRLMKSASIIGLEHQFTADQVMKNIEDLLTRLSLTAANLKILLIGGPDKDTANLYIMALNPLFPDRKLYKSGAHCILEPCERLFPQAKTLNMLPSYLAYRKAKVAEAYDALLVNRDGNITEGTRTNFFGLTGKTIYSAPEADILLGVTRDHVIKVAEQNGFKLIHKGIAVADLSTFEAAFLTSTSTKIMPIRTAGTNKWDKVSPELVKLMQAFDKFLETGSI